MLEDWSAEFGHVGDVGIFIAKECNGKHHERAVDGARFGGFALEDAKDAVNNEDASNEVGDVEQHALQAG